jgi:hypothetical protein
VSTTEQQLRAVAEAKHAYAEVLATAGECIHGVIGGEIVRPWIGNPACAMCRRRNPVHWWRLRTPAAPV